MFKTPPFSFLFLKKNDESEYGIVVDNDSGSLALRNSVKATYIARIPPRIYTILDRKTKPLPRYFILTRQKAEAHGGGHTTPIGQQKILGCLKPSKLASDDKRGRHTQRNVSRQIVFDIVVGL
jgi:hypothetical protein